MARNKSVISETPDSLPAESVGPPPPASPVERIREDKPSFWDHVAQLDESKWTHHLIYLYRLEPKIDKNGENAFISKYQRALDQADILTDHGSGRYLAMLNDTRNRKTVNKVTFTIHNQAYPPRVVISQLVATPENDKWLDWLGRVDEGDEKQIAATLAAEGNGLAQLAAIIQRIVEKGNATDSNVSAMLMDAHRQAIDMVASQGKGNTDLNALLDALTKAKTLVAPTAAPADPLASLNSVLALIDKLKPAAEKDPLESVTRTLELLERIKRTAGAEPAAETTGWEKAIGLAGGLLAPVLAPIGQAIAMKMSGAGRMPMMPAAPPVSAPIAADSIAGHAMPAAPVMPVPGSQTDATVGMRQLTEAELAHIQELLIANAATMQRFFDGGRNGTDYADYFIEGHGVPDWQSLRDFGFQNLIALIQQFPPAWNNIAPRLSQFERFMTEFYAWTPEDADEGTNEGEADNGEAA